MSRSRAITDGSRWPEQYIEGRCKRQRMNESDDGDDNESTSDADRPRGRACLLGGWCRLRSISTCALRLVATACPASLSPSIRCPPVRPACLQESDGLPRSRPPANIRSHFPTRRHTRRRSWPSRRILTASVRNGFRRDVFASTADRWWTDVAELLDPKGHDLRAWLASSFFEYHLKRHSKSRRKAPISLATRHPLGPLQRVALCSPPHAR